MNLPSPPDLRLSIIIPVYNEAATIDEVVRKVRALKLRLEVIAVNDASTDASGTALDRLATAGQLDRVIHQPENRGKGAALRAGFAAATGDVVVVRKSTARPADDGNAEQGGNATYSLDQLEGTLLDVGAGGVQLEFDGAKINIRREKLDG